MSHVSQGALGAREPREPGDLGARGPRELREPHEPGVWAATGGHMEQVSHVSRTLESSPALAGAPREPALEGSWLPPR